MKRFFLLSLISLWLMSTAIAQTKDISGNVIDEHGEGLPGVSIQIEGTTSGAITDFNGNFQLSFDEKHHKLKVSYIGYLTQFIDVSTVTNVQVQLVPDVEELDELVIVGYGVQKKAVVTGAIASVKSDDITSTPVMSPAQAMQGRTAGVQVQTVSGAPGAGVDVRVRGTATNGDNRPLYIVDGVQMQDIDFLNPSDIESMEVLKDAASSAIYGSRAANGVIIITTKGGNSGKMKISYDGFIAIQQPTNKVDLLNSQQYMQLHNQGRINDGQDPKFTDHQIANPAHNTDWQEEVFNAAPMTSHNISINGGSEQSTYLSSLGYYGQQGIVSPDKSHFERINYRLNSEHKINDKVKLGQNLTYSYSKQTGIRENNVHGSILQNVMLHDPLTPVYVTDPNTIEDYDNYPVSPVKDRYGRYYGISEHVTNSIANPLAQIENTYNETQRNNLLGNIYLSADVFEGLTFKTDFGLKVSSVNTRTYEPEAYYNSGNIIDQSAITQSNRTFQNWQWESTLVYNKSVGLHNFSGLLGFTLLSEDQIWTQANRKNNQIPGWDFGYVGNGVADGSQAANGMRYEHRLASFFGRVNYDYDNKYMATLVYRRDGSSRFGANNRFGNFFSVQAGWTISNEDFLKNNEHITFLKLRGGYGQTGNEAIGDFMYLSTIGATPAYPLGANTNTIYNPGMAITAMDNPDLKWEQVEEINIGVDVGLWHDKLTFTTDIYSRTRKGLLDYLPIPSFVGKGSPAANIGDVRNQGVELALTYRKSEGDFNYFITANAAYNTNKVLNIANDEGIIFGDTFFQHTGQSAMVAGMPLPIFYGFKTDGIFQNQAEIDAHVNDKGERIQPNARPGDIRYVDSNGDGKIDANDRTNIGSPVPDWIAGLTVGFNYKGWDFSMFWQGQFGAQMINAVQRRDLAPLQNYNSRYANTWNGEGSTNSFPRMTFNDPNHNYDYINDMVHIEDASYLRLKNIQVGYTFNDEVLNKLKINRLRVYLSLNNLLTFTDYSGFDPELSFGGAMGAGWDKGSYPQAMSFMLGTNISF
ncbi:SusC/RagA family TonB-linked outer membrane protein [Flammeovirga aprica]|uniref:TonB-dependent receptor n=1 Tax=Flammeovirga aprica JL-4 TaxID=694437 RepID=A0A7X9XB65_9BACT|nr:TonB-dependent receptor [Flammeovirga aprica]NME70334.1 TonB-dependent receptor [Flammeovirga aprica JL-4]